MLLLLKTAKCWRSLQCYKQSVNRSIRKQCQVSDRVCSYSCQSKLSDVFRMSAATTLNSAAMAAASAGVMISVPLALTGSAAAGVAATAAASSAAAAASPYAMALIEAETKK